MAHDKAILVPEGLTVHALTIILVPEGLPASQSLWAEGNSPQFSRVCPLFRFLKDAKKNALGFQWRGRLRHELVKRPRCRSSHTVLA